MKIEFWYCEKIEWGYVLEENEHEFKVDLLGIGKILYVPKNLVVE